LLIGLSVLFSTSVGAGLGVFQKEPTYMSKVPKLGFVEKECLVLPSVFHPENTISEDVIDQWLHGLKHIRSTRYATNAHFLSIDGNSDKDRYLRQRYSPSEKGSDRVVIGLNLASNIQLIRLEQELFIESGFDWGGTNEGGKIGFGLGGGSVPSGGKIADDGFSARIMWKGAGDGTSTLGLYSYASDRSKNLPWGDEFILENYSIPVNQWITIRLDLGMNSHGDNSDGYFVLYIDGVQMLAKYNIQWQQSDSPVPSIDQIIYSSFYGGGDISWAPDRDTFSRIRNLCISVGR